MLAEMKMTCSQCRHEGHETDAVTTGRTSSHTEVERTRIGFVYQDPNTYKFQLDCPRGHRFSVAVRQVI